MSTVPGYLLLLYMLGSGFQEEILPDLSDVREIVCSFQVFVVVLKMFIIFFFFPVARNPLLPHHHDFSYIDSSLMVASANSFQ